MAAQHVEGEGKQLVHTHATQRHAHDHYHVTHHHAGGVLGVGEWDHRTFWHSHEHTHNELTHSHDYSQEDEDLHHGKVAHNHRHED